VMEGKGNLKRQIGARGARVRRKRGGEIRRDRGKKVECFWRVSVRELRRDGGATILWEKRVKWVMRWVKSLEIERAERDRSAEVKGVRHVKRRSW
jgi:hypothetical protein